MSNFEDVRDFNKKFGILYEGPPKLLDAEVQAYRTKFMLEELNEYISACNEGDLAGQFDALLDLVYVAMGTALFQGFPWEAGWNEVQRANMSKVRATSVSQSKRGSTYDVIKPPGWRGPDLKSVLERAASSWAARRDAGTSEPSPGRPDEPV